MDIFRSPSKPLNLSPTGALSQEKTEQDKTGAAALVRIATPGEILQDTHGFMGGHGTYMDGGTLCCNVAGRVQFVGKLCTVKSMTARYVPEAGNIVVGRIREMRGKAWKVDINSRQHGILLLSALHLPDIQRRKTETDEAEMRRYLSEGDVVSVEVSDCRNDRILLQTRNTNKTGKLKNGSLVVVPASLVVRGISQVVHLKSGVDMVLGMNGYIWVRTFEADATDSNSIFASEKNWTLTQKKFGQTEAANVTGLERVMIARTCNVIGALARQNIPISEAAVNVGYEYTMDMELSEIVRPEKSKLLAEAVQLAILENNLTSMA